MSSGGAGQDPSDSVPGIGGPGSSEASPDGQGALKPHVGISMVGAVGAPCGRDVLDVPATVTGGGPVTSHRPLRTEPAPGTAFEVGSRRSIDQATGLLMGAFAVDARTATAVLTWLARRTDVALSVVAGRFLDAAHGVNLAAASREQLDGVLAALTGSTTSS